MKKSYIFVASSKHKGGRTRLYAAGIFFALMLQTIYGSVPPCNSIMELLPLWWNSTGKAEPFFISASLKQLSVMSSTEKNCLTGKNTGINTSHSTKTIPTLFVNRRIDITEQINKFSNYQSYRTRLSCNCDHSNQRDGAIIAEGDKIIRIIVRCKDCAKNENNFKCNNRIFIHKLS